MRGFIVAAASVVAVAHVAAQGVQADHYLDIPGHTQTGTSGAGSFFPMRNSFATTGHAPPNPLRLTLLSVERSDFVFGARFVYDVLIENTGRETVIIPWSPDRGAFVQPAPRIPDGFRTGIVFLEVESAAGKALGLLDGQPLYGSNEVPRTLLPLAPGRTARMRVPGWWSAGTDDAKAAMLRQPDGVVHLRAGFAIDDFPLARSANIRAVRVAVGHVQ